MRRWASAVWAAMTLFVAPLAYAEAVKPLDCPLRTAPYSIDSPLIDLLNKPEAVAVVKSAAPQLLGGMGAAAAVSTGPSITTILSVRVIAGFAHVPDEKLAPIDRALRAIPVTLADQRLRCARYDDDGPALVIPAGHPRLLLFEKMTGFRDGPSVNAAHAALQAIAARHGWSLAVSDKAGVMRPATLAQFDAVIWNNVSGDVLTLTQRHAFRRYIEHGGGYVGIHGSGGDFNYPWDWYADTLLGAHFIGHPMAPQFQDARIVVAPDSGEVGAGLAPGWSMKDEWYSFRASPRAAGAHVVATLDEASYSPKGIAGQDLRMGDHPIAWTRCVKAGRAFYSAIGHRPESYAEPHHVALLEQAIDWAAGTGTTLCRRAREVRR